MKADSKGEGERILKRGRWVLRVKKVRERMRDKRGGDDSNAVSGGSREVPSAISAIHGVGTGIKDVHLTDYRLHSIGDGHVYPDEAPWMERDSGGSDVRPPPPNSSSPISGMRRIV
ncbi:hypothetical protein CEXT_796171 [Caerostris extrusa]|uniref:Uncharacterized protein n=1 Tax=Caerostris extrusa TaxID=172846 RepID=A0AAV4R0U8_CAEEX|nr:hypothetical protein CEXT_796171 [Caerostris extrusa]